ncbi:peptidase M56, partial [Klebsiella oxytoca]
PLTYGIIHPVILLPKSTDWTDTERLNYVLEHELAHIRHFDAAAKLALTAAVCVHWFNPLVWLMLSLANRD